MDISPRLSGDNWQIWAEKLIQRHYGPGEYQKVPDNDRGDAGIEGFTISAGHAYQIYGPEGEPLSTRERYEKHRTKMTNDIKKFIDNHLLLCKLFGNVKISRWILFVPKLDSKEIIVHAAKKTNEVLEMNLPYVADNFRVCVDTEAVFSVEREELLNSNLSQIDFATETICTAKFKDWIDQNDTLVATADDKLTRLKSLNNEKERFEFRNNLVKIYLEGQNTLTELRNYPTAYENVKKIKGERERFLQLESQSISTPQDILSRCLQTINDAIKETPGISQTIIDHIKWEAIADWIFRCPLDFPE